jgi:hypothetical protein
MNASTVVPVTANSQSKSQAKTQRRKGKTKIGISAKGTKGSKKTLSKSAQPQMDAGLRRWIAAKQDSLLKPRSGEIFMA